MPSRANLPIIVGGSPRSGTTLLRRVLNGHSNIHCGPEVKFFDDFFSNYVNDELKNIRFFSTLKTLVEPEMALEAMGRTYIELNVEAARAHNKHRWADKNPSNALFLNKWQKLLGEDFVFIHVVRNPLDTVASLKEMNFSLSVPKGLMNRIEFYKRHFELPLKLRIEYPEQYYCVVYEEFVRAPWTETGRLMTWLGEMPESTQLDVSSDKHGRGIEDPKINHRKQINEVAVGRWEGTLSSYEAEMIWLETAHLWLEFDPKFSFLPSKAPRSSWLKRVLNR